MPNSVEISNIKEDKTHVLVTFDNLNDQFLIELQEACIASGRDFEFDGSNVVRFKHLTSKTYAESQARKLIRDTLGAMKKPEDTEIASSTGKVDSSPIIKTANFSSPLNSPVGEVIVTDISMPFLSMVIFMVKWSIASMPALFILYVVGYFFTVLIGNIF
ncbi:hypothetical protein KO507_09340 [Gilvimarinus agarilyticus]|uniref:hypothetical protein n=1 Tax=Gilvimarinus sp. 2_MG-2023 TaxID=3062666 RepID=UPI001C08DD25|nr:hypothetical protein [Gilvimarinus sp. 2_MG-2023]MBU2885963.1 hypothetical protein [Gilvimarinus agarilyticus]MDO6570709.1 hypothetical protein [Gilvimarinus sp. 2_MG-2023]